MSSILVNQNSTEKAQKIQIWSLSWLLKWCTHTFHRCCLQVLWFQLLCFRRFLQPSTVQPPQITQKVDLAAVDRCGVTWTGEPLTYWVEALADATICQIMVFKHWLWVGPQLKYWIQLWMMAGWLQDKPVLALFSSEKLVIDCLRHE